MGDSRLQPGFDSLDLDLEDGTDTPAFGNPTIPVAARRSVEGTPESGVAVRDGRVRSDDEPTLDLGDPFGGLVFIDDSLAATAPPPAPAALTVIPLAVPSAAPHLSLTARHSIPTLLKSAGEVCRLPIDHRAGFLLAHVDGMQTLEEILDVCAMPMTEALELIGRLKEMGVIAFE